nr:serine hydroxymethyltransferase [Candidatus Njordarchaeum guaymaensis]
MNSDSPQQSYSEVRNLLREHHKWFDSSIPLIASENVPSPAIRAAVASDFGNRYAEGWPGERVYAGTKYIDQVELICDDLAKKLFKAEFADVRPISGVVANLVVYTAFTESGDRMMALPIPAGGHISHAKRTLGGTAGAVHGLKVRYFGYDEKELNIDIDKSIKRIKKMLKRGKAVNLLMFGASVFPFPHPVKEFRDIADEMGAFIAYDGAHVAGLIAGGCFQDPLREGADVLSMSTHKTLPGPQGGLVLSWQKYAERVKKATFPGLVSNHHLNCVAGKAIAFLEMLSFGREYAKQIISNAKDLGQSLYEQGFNVLAEHKGFTESHTVLVDITNTPLKDGRTCEEALERANIIVNRNLLPWDIREGRHYLAPGGIRLGASEVTRIGMKESDMKEIATFIKRVIIEQEDTNSVEQDVEKFRQSFKKVKYCFSSQANAYEYFDIE